MSGLAKIMLQSGYKISGSDIKENFLTRRLKEEGAIIYQGHQKEQIEDSDLVIFSSAIREDNPERLEAEARRIPLISRGEFVARIANLQENIVVAGTHGKTTTTALIAELLLEDGRDPTLLMGGILRKIGSNSRLGRSRWMVIESDESDGSFLFLRPSIAVITNVEDDHLDYYHSRTNLLTAFGRFIQKVKPGGVAVINLDDSGLRHLLKKEHLSRCILTYGLNPHSDISARDIRLEALKSSFKIIYRNSFLGEVEVPLPGIHNLYNCLAAVGVGIKLGITWEKIKKSITFFSGVKRRLEKIGEAGSILVFDDYAHHPTEIEATLKEINRLGRRVLAIFQPHRYTRTRLLLPRFSTAFDLADLLILTPIYSAGEPPLPDIDEKTFFEVISRKRKLPTYYLSSPEEIVGFIKDKVRENDLIITLGAGDISQLSTKILSYLLKREELR